MFTAGFRESDELEIEIPDCSYSAFVAVMEYAYTGALPRRVLDVSPRHDDRDVMPVVEILELADRFFLDHLKQMCESQLQLAVTIETVEYLLPVAQKTNSSQLLAICEHVWRNRETTPAARRWCNE
jgi:leucine-zipper-like transcriptional regulator 1